MKILTSFGRVLILSILCVAASASSHVEHSQNVIASALDPDFERARNVVTADSVLITLEGAVFAPDGTPAEGAVVVSTAGGEAVTDPDGKFRLTVRVPRPAKSVQVTAVGGAGGKLLASQQVALAASFGSVVVAPLQLAQSNTCIPGWLPTFGGAPGTDGRLQAMTVFDDGGGAALFVGGHFDSAGGVEASRVAKWDGSSWTALGTGIDGFVEALAVFDDGTGPALYVGGNFTTAGGLAVNHIAKWDGSAWAALGNGVLFVSSPGLTHVQALTVFDDGNGERLLVGGTFNNAGGVAAKNIASWDGSSWTPLGSGTQARVHALAVFDGGNGERLIVGGPFTSAGGLPANRIAEWDGSTWAALGSGLNQVVHALTVFDDGNGDRLFVGGNFTTAGGAPASRIAKWDGSTWTPLGGGMNDHVLALTAFDDGTGEQLFAGGRFTTADGVFASRIASWNGSTWAPLGTGVIDVAPFSTVTEVRALTLFDDGTGERLFAGGRFTSAGGVAALNNASWDGSSWSALGKGLDNQVRALTVFDDGSGAALYAGGDFLTAGGMPASRIAKWDGSTWTALGAGLNDVVYSLSVYDDGNGERLFAGGDFTNAGGIAVDYIAKWDGANWAGLGSDMNDSVFAMTVFDDGSGEQLFAGGRFTMAGGVAVGRIAKWDGLSWTAPKGGVSNGPHSAWINALTVFDDGNGEQLFAGGHFTRAGGGIVNWITKWNGSNWSALGSGVGNPVFALTVFDDGGGPALFVGGNFLTASGVAANKIAKWDGSNWTPLGSGIDGSPVNDRVASLAVFDDGGGAALYAGGTFQSAGGTLALHIAKWDGSSWAALGGGVSWTVSALIALDDGGGDALYVGGNFERVPETGDSYLAKWACQPELMNDFCNGDGGDQLGCTNCPCGNNSLAGTIGGCLNSALTSSRLIASGSLSVSLPLNSSDDLRFALTGAPPTAFCTLNSGDAVAPNNPVNPCFGLGSGVQAMQLDGLRCAIVNTRRHGGRSADVDGSVGAVTAAWGGSDNPPIGIAQAGGGFAAGQTRYFQVFHRDDPLLGCMRGLNTSQAIEVAFQP